jgi:hypothetical protein
MLVCCRPIICVNMFHPTTARNSKVICAPMVPGGAQGAGPPRKNRRPAVRGSTLRLLDELLAPSAPAMAVVAAPGRAFLGLGDGPVGGVLHLRGNVPAAVPGPRAGRVADGRDRAVAVLEPTLGGDVDAERDSRADALPAVTFMASALALPS